ncbi:hypothetical protein OURE66S_00499 [Oligella ureolytica]
MCWPQVWRAGWRLLVIKYIPADRIIAANRVSPFIWAVLPVFGIIQVPYHVGLSPTQRMNAYAFISMTNAVLKLSAAYILLGALVDRFILYSQLLAIIAIVSFVAYFVLCANQFRDIKYIKYFDKKYYQEILSFSGLQSVW